MNIIQALEQEQLRSDIPKFAPGDTVRVHVKVVEGTRERIQAFEGVVIARSGTGVLSRYIRRVWTRSSSCAAASCVVRSSITCATLRARRLVSARSAEAHHGDCPRRMPARHFPFAVPLSFLGGIL